MENGSAQEKFLALQDLRDKHEADVKAWEARLNEPHAPLEDRSFIENLLHNAQRRLQITMDEINALSGHIAEAKDEGELARSKTHLQATLNDRQIAAASNDVSAPHPDALVLQQLDTPDNTSEQIARAKLWVLGQTDASDEHQESQNHDEDSSAATQTGTDEISVDSRKSLIDHPRSPQHFR